LEVKNITSNKIYSVGDYDSDCDLWCFTLIISRTDSWSSQYSPQFWQCSWDDHGGPSKITVGLLSWSPTLKIWVDSRWNYLFHSKQTKTFFCYFWDQSRLSAISLLSAYIFFYLSVSNCSLKFRWETWAIVFTSVFLWFFEKRHFQSILYFFSKEKYNPKIIFCILNLVRSQVYRVEKFEKFLLYLPKNLFLFLYFLIKCHILTQILVFFGPVITPNIFKNNVFLINSIRDLCM